MIETTNNNPRRPEFTHEQMAQAFDRVRDPHDWRGPIRAEIPIEMQAVVAAAVMCFTATDPVFEPVGRPDLLLATAPGYLRGPWAVPTGPVRSSGARG